MKEPREYDSRYPCQCRECNAPNTEVICPKCDSGNEAFDVIGESIAYDCKCPDCGHEWDLEEAEDADND